MPVLRRLMRAPGIRVEAETMADATLEADAANRQIREPD